MKWEDLGMVASKPTLTTINSTLLFLRSSAADSQSYSPLISTSLSHKLMSQGGVCKSSQSVYSCTSFPHFMSFFYRARTWLVHHSSVTHKNNLYMPHIHGCQGSWPDAPWHKRVNQIGSCAWAKIWFVTFGRHDMFGQYFDWHLHMSLFESVLKAILYSAYWLLYIAALAL